jgi:hypothetical protein
LPAKLVGCHAMPYDPAAMDRLLDRSRQLQAKAARLRGVDEWAILLRADADLLIESSRRAASTSRRHVELATRYLCRPV